MRTPPIVGILSALVLLAVIHEWWPELIPAYLGLVALYLMLTNIDRARALLQAGPEALARALQPRAVAGAPRPSGVGGGPARLVSA